MKLVRILTLLLSVYFVFFTFYNLNWGAPYYFHPDERNIAASVAQLKFPENLNPHFFAYGTLPIYTAYALGVIGSLNFMVGFDQAIVLLRFMSALLTLGIVLLIYILTKELGGKKSGLIALIISFTSVAFFQYSHFGTYETWISFTSLLMVYFLLRYHTFKKRVYLIAASALFGIICGLKFSNITLIIVPGIVILINIFGSKLSLKTIWTAAKEILIFSYLSIFTYLLTAPYNIIDYQSFINSMLYEGGVAMGNPVFYTGEFYNSIPIIFQVQKVLPFLINPVLTIILIPAVIFCATYVYKQRSTPVLIILLTTLTLFVSNSILFVKWTRYLIPAVPFTYILIALFLSEISRKMGRHAIVATSSVLIIVGLSFSFSFLKTVRIDADTRILARDFADKNTNNNAEVLSEVYDLGIIPFNEVYKNITLLNLYDVDPGSGNNVIIDLAQKSDYIIIPSPRIYKTRILNSKEFPNGHEFYSNLYDGNLGYKLIYETPCDIFCKIVYLGDEINNFEGTTNVFDRPTVFIFGRK